MNPAANCVRARGTVRLEISHLVGGVMRLHFVSTFVLVVVAPVPVCQYWHWNAAGQISSYIAWQDPHA